MSKSKDQIKLVVIVLIIMAVVVLIAVLQAVDFTPKNDTTAIGNTAGNLYNGGYFCESEGNIYFSWPADDHTVYCMKPDGSFENTEIADAFSLNVCNGYLYYGRNGATSGPRSFLDRRPFGVYRVSLSSGRSKVLCSSLSAYVCLSGNDLYLQEYTDTSYYFSRVNIKNANDFERITSTGYQIACADNGYLYYSEINGNHNIYRYDTETGNAELFYEGNCHQPIYENGRLYYIDLDDNYALKCYDNQTGAITVIASDHCINYNVSDAVVIYQIENPDNSHYALYRNNINGTNEELIDNGSFCHINIAGDYAYFQRFNDDYNFYRVSLTGSPLAEDFMPDLLSLQ